MTELQNTEFNQLDQMPSVRQQINIAGLVFVIVAIILIICSIFIPPNEALHRAQNRDIVAAVATMLAIIGFILFFASLLNVR